MLEPVNTVLKAVKRLGLLRGDRVLVAGQGPIGLMFTRLLTLARVDVFATDLFENRLAMSRRLGARWTLDVAGKEDSTGRIRALLGGGGLDAAIVAVPSDEVVTQSIGLLNGGGKVLVFAHTKRGGVTGIDLASVCVDEKDILGSYSADVTLQKEVASLVFGRKLDVRALISDRFGLEDGVRAVEKASQPGPDGLKVLILPTTTERETQKMFNISTKKS
jgi:L-iditol 2-dehydrogenase